MVETRDPEPTCDARLAMKGWRSLNQHTRDIVAGGGIAFVTRGAGTVVALVFNLVLARLLGASGTGIYFLALSVVMAAAIIGRFGLDNTLLRLIAAGEAAADWSAVRGAYRMVNRFGVGTSAVIIVVFLTGSPWLAIHVFHKPELAGPLRWMMLATFPLVAVTMSGVALQGLRRIFEAKVVDGILTPTVALALLFPLVRAFGVRGAVMSQVLGASIAACIGYGLWRRATSGTGSAATQFTSGEILNSSIPLFVYALLTWVMNWIGTWLLGVWGTSADVGTFALAARTTQIIGMLLAAVNTVVAPKFAALFEQHNLPAVGDSAQHATLIVTLLGVPVIAVFVIAPSWVMSLYGREFLSGAPILAVLALGQLVNLVTGPVVYLLMMTKMERSARNAAIVGASCSLAVGTLLVPHFGGFGAAVATALGLTGANVSAAVSVYREFDLVMLPVPLKRFRSKSAA